jgi:hypothetical protein
MDLKSLTCEIAQTPAALVQVYRLRHDCYLRKGSIAARPNGLFCDTYDELPNSFSFLVRNAAGEAMATARMTVVIPDMGWSTSPAQKVFGDHAAFQGIAKASYVEASRLCFAQQARRDAFVGLLGHMAAMAEYWGLEWLVACPRMEHAHVYQRLFGFREMAEPRQYYGVDFQTQLLGIRRVEIAEYVRDARPLRNAWAAAFVALSEAFQIQAFQAI